MNKCYNFLKILIISFLISGCATGPNDNVIITTIYNNQFAPDVRGLQLLLNAEIISTGSAKKLGDMKLFPVTVKINFMQGGLEMGYTGQGPGKYAQEYEVELIREFMFYRDNNDKWHISVWKDLNRKEFEKVWRPGNKKMEDFYKDKIILNTEIIK